MIDTLTNYGEEDQKSIMRTLTAVQRKGWTHGQDPFQFYIILGSVIRERETQIKEVEETLEEIRDQNEEKVNEINKLKEDIKNEKKVNEEMEEELERRDGETKSLHSCVKDRDDIIKSLDEVIKEHINEISDLRENCESLAVTAGKEMILEKKLETANAVIKDLDEKLKVEKLETIGASKEIVTLMLEIEILQSDIKEKEKLLDVIEDENKFLKEEHKSEKDTSIEVLDYFQKEGPVSLSEEFSNTCQQVKTFECKFCGQYFETRNDLNLHKRRIHGSKKLLSERIEQLEMEIGTQKLNITENLLALKEKETNDEGRCYCKGNCKINHKIYNWIKSECTNLYSKYRKKISNDDEIAVDGGEAILKKCSLNAWGLNFLDLN